MNASWTGDAIKANADVNVGLAMAVSDAVVVGVVVVALSAGAATLNGQQNAGTNTNGLEPTPLLGWSTWSFLRKEPTADKLEAQARAMRDSGLQKLGYTYINLDDFWYQCPGPARS
jgi:hypothetical protein